MNIFIEPLQYSFIQRALIASVLVGIACALLGVYVVLRRMSNIGHALTHSAFPGIVIAFMLKVDLFLGALASTLLTALGIGFLAKDDKVYEDTATGMLPTVMFAIGVMLISATRSYRDMSAMLFGNILGVTNQDLILTVVITVIITLVLLLLRKELILFSVDANYARTIGINTALLRFIVLILLTLAVVVGIQAVGTILTNALLIAPPAAARLLTDRFKPMMLIAVLFAVTACVGGVYISYYFGLSSGASIVLLCALFFIVAWVYQRLRK